jgi:hypothetical protein
MVVETVQNIAAGQTFAFTVGCPIGTSGQKKVLGGGVGITGNAVTISGNLPAADGAGWFIAGNNGSASTAAAIRGRAVCADAN